MAASVAVSAVNLSGQRKNFTMRKILEGNTIYYIPEFPAANEKILDFDIQVLPEGQAATFDAGFRRRFITG